jgi:hypothetical protein
MVATDEDCEYCEAQLEGQQRVLNEMGESIMEINGKLARLTGVPYVENAVAVAALKTDVLVAMIFTDPKARMAYELNFANALISQMNMVHQHIIRQQIVDGGKQQIMPVTMPGRRG